MRSRLSSAVLFDGREMFRRLGQERKGIPQGHCVPPGDLIGKVECYDLLAVAVEVHNCLRARDTIVSGGDDEMLAKRQRDDSSFSGGK